MWYIIKPIFFIVWEIFKIITILCFWGIINIFSLLLFFKIFPYVNLGIGEGSIYDYFFTEETHVDPADKSSKETLKHDYYRWFKK